VFNLYSRRPRLFTPRSLFQNKSGEESSSGNNPSRLEFTDRYEGEPHLALGELLPIILRGLRCHKIFHPLTNFVTNATENRKPFIIASYAGRRRVLKALVNALGLSRKQRAGLFRVVADCNHGIEFLADELIYRIRPVTGNTLIVNSPRFSFNAIP
jgi:hypothetical protein